MRGTFLRDAEEEIGADEPCQDLPENYADVKEGDLGSGPKAASPFTAENQIPSSLASDS